MEKLSISQQTLQEFIENPFGQPNEQKHLKYEDRYQNFKRNNRIRIEATMELDKNYFVHVKVPSESQKGLTYYDVVIQFFTPNKEVERETNLNHYYVQFFSNSPGFIYKYAALYSLQGYLIETLVDKYKPGMLEVLPDKANKDYELYFDSSIYYACRYILDNKLRVMPKLNFKIFKTKRPSAFFADIQDSEETEINRSVAAIENKFRKEIHSDMKLSEQQETKLKRKPIFQKEISNKRRAKTSTYKDSKDSGVSVKSASSNTSKTKSSVTTKRASSKTSSTKSSVTVKRAKSSTKKKS